MSVGGASARIITRLARVESNSSLARAAAQVAAALLQKLPAPPRASALPASGAGSARNMLVLVNCEGIQRRLSKNADRTDFDQRLLKCGWAIAQAAVLAVLTEHAAWHVHTASNHDKAERFVDRIVRTADAETLLTRDA